MDKSSLGDRMKGYENIPNVLLTRRTPTIIRLDGRAFHTFTRNFDRPFDIDFHTVMAQVTAFLVDNIQGCQMGYTQSDEISLLLTDYDTLTTDAWFGKKVQKMVSISAAMATMRFNQCLYDGLIPKEKIGTHTAMFDSRVWTLPREEVVNYFVWRQQDATRNSIQMVAQANFSHSSLQGISCAKLQDKLMEEKEINWNDTPTRFKRGFCVRKYISDVCRGQTIDTEIPIFTQDRNYIQRYVDIDLGVE